MIAILMATMNIDAGDDKYRMGYVENKNAFGIKSSLVDAVNRNCGACVLVRLMIRNYMS